MQLERVDIGRAAPETDFEKNLEKSWQRLVDQLFQLLNNGLTFEDNFDAISAVLDGPGISATKTTVNGSVAGSAVFSQPFQWPSFKKVLIYCNALNGTASYTFPTPFSHVPMILSQASGAGIVSAISATAITLTGVVSTGWYELAGY